MSQEIIVHTAQDIYKIGEVMAKSRLFGVTTPEQAIALCFIAQAEGRHPAIAANDYNIIQNRPAKKSEAMLRDFLASGGKVEWHASTDDIADATFSHPAGGSLRVTWDKSRATMAGIGGKENWKKYPRQMLRARCVSEGVRAVCPAATSGMYVPEEVQDFDPPKTIDQEPKVVEPESTKKTEKEELTIFAKQYAVEIELCDLATKLDALLVKNAVDMGRLHDKYPKSHEKLMALIERQRTTFSPQPKEELPFSYKEIGI